MFHSTYPFQIYLAHLYWHQFCSKIINQQEFKPSGNAEIGGNFKLHTGTNPLNTVTTAWQSAPRSLQSMLWIYISAAKPLKENIEAWPPSSIDSRTEKGNTTVCTITCSRYNIYASVRKSHTGFTRYGFRKIILPSVTVSLTLLLSEG